MNKEKPHLTNKPIYIEPLLQSIKPKEEQDNDFYLLAQSRASNKLQKTITQKITDPAQLTLLGDGKIEDKDFRLFIKGYNEIANIKQSAAMLLDGLMIAATETGLNDTLVKMPLKRYMDMRELKDEKEARKGIKQDIDALERVSFEYKGTGKQLGAWLKVSIAGGTVGQIKNGDIIFRFNQDFFDSFKAGNGRYLYMYFPREALQGNIRQNPHKYWLARIISEHKRMNINKPNADIISVKTLIEACPHFPTYNDVVRGNGAIEERIIRPFERDMDELNQSLSWAYTDRKDTPPDYQSFISSTVTITWKYYPDVSGLIENKNKRDKKQKASNEKER